MTDVFEQVRTGILSPRAGADELARRRAESWQAQKPTWTPRVIWVVISRLLGK